MTLRARHMEGVGSAQRRKSANPPSTRYGVGFRIAVFSTAKSSFDTPALCVPASVQRLAQTECPYERIPDCHHWPGGSDAAAATQSQSASTIRESRLVIPCVEVPRRCGSRGKPTRTAALMPHQHMQASEIALRATRLHTNPRLQLGILPHSCRSTIRLFFRPE